VSKKRSIESIISTELPLSEVWNSLLTPDPFPGNLFIDDGTTYVCYPLGTGRIGGYRFEYGKHQWLIMRLTSADLNAQRIRWDLVDIKSGPIRVFELSIELSNESGVTNVALKLNVQYSTFANFFGYFHTRRLKKKLASLAI
jgi:hypothetical protein